MSQKQTSKFKEREITIRDKPFWKEINKFLSNETNIPLLTIEDTLEKDDSNWRLEGVFRHG